MLDVGIGIFICLFVVLGFYEGLAKSLLSAIFIFLALYFTSGVMFLLARISNQLADPQNLGAIITFMIVWLIIYGGLEILLTLILRKLILISFFFPFDKLGGLSVGLVKGFLIVAILLQLIIAMPLQATSKTAINNSLLASVSVGIYCWSAPFTKNFIPMTQSWWQQSQKIKIDNLPPQKSEGLTLDLIINKNSSDKIPQPAIPLPKSITEQDKLINLLKDQNLLPSAPSQGGPGK